MAKFKICKHCKNLAEMVHVSGVNMICCNDPMTDLVANTTDAAQEKHVPVITVEGDIVKVEVGSVKHPMTAEHHIAWIYLLSSEGIQRKMLEVTDEPVAEFICKGKNIEVYEYCNLHGLWKTSL